VNLRHRGGQRGGGKKGEKGEATETWGKKEITGVDVRGERTVSRGEVLGYARYEANNLQVSNPE